MSLQANTFVKPVHQFGLVTIARQSPYPEDCSRQQTPQMTRMVTTATPPQSVGSMRTPSSNLGLRQKIYPEDLSRQKTSQMTRMVTTAIPPQSVPSMGIPPNKLSPRQSPCPEDLSRQQTPQMTRMVTNAIPPQSVASRGVPSSKLSLRLTSQDNSLSKSCGTVNDTSAPVQLFTPRQGVRLISQDNSLSESCGTVRDISAPGKFFTTRQGVPVTRMASAPVKEVALRQQQNIWRTNSTQRQQADEEQGGQIMYLGSNVVADALPLPPVKGCRTPVTDVSTDDVSSNTSEDPLRILLLVSAYNGLTQGAHRLLEKLGHMVTIEFASDTDTIWTALEAFAPDLVICPFLKEFVPVEIFKKYTVLILHPGIVGDRGPSSIDWALLEGQREWGVVVVEGHEEFDAGDVWAYRNFPIPEGATKSRVYGELVTDAALASIEDAVKSFYLFRRGIWKPEAIDFEAPWVLGKKLPLMRQADCTINWESDTAVDIVRKIASRDGQPGVMDEIAGRNVYLYGAHLEAELIGEPKSILAIRNGAVCFGARDGAVWITHMRCSKLKQDANKACVPHAEKLYKLPAAIVMQFQLGFTASYVRSLELSIGFTPAPCPTFQDIVYQKRGEIGMVLFQFYNGAMGTSACKRLVACLQYAKEQLDTKVIVVAGGGVLTNHASYFSNGIDLNAIDFATDPAQEGWENINAIDDACLEILSSTDHLMLACICGNAGAGGIMLPLGADMVVAKQGLVFNPHYKAMGLFGSEYWTFSLPKRVGEDMAEKLTSSCMPISSDAAKELGMVDKIFDGRCCDVMRLTLEEARSMSSNHSALITKKMRDRQEADAIKPLHAYREEELAQMRMNFFDDSLGFARKRFDFVHKTKVVCAPNRIAKHRK